MASEIQQIDGSIGRTFLIPATRWAQEPTFRTIGKLEEVLNESFTQTQAAVHVITGSLKLSGKIDSDFRRAEGVWEGTITYGGESDGVYNPVKYAIFELARGGTHNFFGSMPSFTRRYGQILAEAFSEDDAP